MPAYDALTGLLLIAGAGRHGHKTCLLVDSDSVLTR